MKRRKIILSILSFMYSSFIIIGTSFFVSNSFKFFSKYLILNLLAYILLFIAFYKVLDKLFNYFENLNIII